MIGGATVGCSLVEATAALVSTTVFTLVRLNETFSSRRLLKCTVSLAKRRRGDPECGSTGRCTACCSRAAAIAVLASIIVSTLDCLDDLSSGGRLLDREVRSKERRGELGRGMGGRWTAGSSRAAAIAALASSTLDTVGYEVSSNGSLLDRGVRSKQRRGELERGMGGRWTAGCSRAAAIAALASNTLATLDLSSGGLSSSGRLLDREVRLKEPRGDVDLGIAGRWTAGCSRAAAIDALASSTLATVEYFDDVSSRGRLLDRDARSPERRGKVDLGMGGR